MSSSYQTERLILKNKTIQNKCQNTTRLRNGRAAHTQTSVDGLEQDPENNKTCRVAFCKIETSDVWFLFAQSDS